MSILQAAQAWFEAGCSIFPPLEDGSKRPRGEWKQFQHRRMSPEEVHSYFTAKTQGVGIICGKISGNLEMLELEGRATNSQSLDAIVAECQARDIDWLWEQLTQAGYAEWTPSGGLHFLYKVKDHEVPGNTKVARRLATEAELSVNPQDKIKTLSETRGEGGYVIVAPSGGTVHPSGDSWSLQAGRIGQIPTVSWADRCLLHEAITAALDEMPAEPTPLIPRHVPLSGSLNSDRPGDDFQMRASWEEILNPHGWRALHMAAGTTYWLRPGKQFAGKNSHSATTGHAGIGTADRLYVFSSSTVFDPERPYNKFHAYAVLNHNGDFSAAAKELGRLGYGAQDRSDGDARLVLDSIKAPAAVAPAGSPQASVPQAAQPEQVSWKKKYVRPALSPQDFLTEEFTVRGAGNLYAQAFEDGFKYCHKLGKWLYWDGRVWREDETLLHEQATSAILDIGHVAALQADEVQGKALRKHLHKMANAAAPGIHRWAKTDDRIAVREDDLDADTHLITLANGIYDLNSHTMMPHDPKMLLTKQLTVTYDKDAQAPKWLKFLEDVLPDVEVRQYLQRAVGHALLGRAEQRAMFLLHGDSGCGKSQFVRVMELLFGDFAETANAQAFNASSKTATVSNDLNDLKGKRFVSLSELDEGEILNESLIKRLTGGDTAKSRGLYKENTTWRVNFALFLATNHLPKLNSDDNAIWRRVKPVHFPNVFAETAGEILALGDKLFAEEAAGILNWVLEGVAAYQDEGLTDLHQIRTAVTAYRKEVDVVEQFIEQALEDNRIVAGTEQVINPVVLYGVFTEWCKSNNHKYVLAQRRFLARIERMGYTRTRTSRERLVKGLGIGSRGMLGTMFPVRA